ncbi:unnamed protein product, partial [Durusdinium trenchii]
MAAKRQDGALKKDHGTATEIMFEFRKDLSGSDRTQLWAAGSGATVGSAGKSSDTTLNRRGEVKELDQHQLVQRAFALHIEAQTNAVQQHADATAKAAQSAARTGCDGKGRAARVEAQAYVVFDLETPATALSSRNLE